MSKNVSFEVWNMNVAMSNDIEIIFVMISNAAILDVPSRISWSPRFCFLVYQFQCLWWS